MSSIETSEHEPDQRNQFEQDVDELKSIISDDSELSKGIDDSWFNIIENFDDEDFVDSIKNSPDQVADILAFLNTAESDEDILDQFPDESRKKVEKIKDRLSSEISKKIYGASVDSIEGASGPEDFKNQFENILSNLASSVQEVEELSNYGKQLEAYSNYSLDAESSEELRNMSQSLGEIKDSLKLEILKFLNDEDGKLDSNPDRESLEKINKVLYQIESLQETLESAADRIQKNKREKKIKEKRKKAEERDQRRADEVREEIGIPTKNDELQESEDTESSVQELGDIVSDNSSIDSEGIVNMVETYLEFDDYDVERAITESYESLDDDVISDEIDDPEQAFRELLRTEISSDVSGDTEEVDSEKELIFESQEMRQETQELLLNLMEDEKQAQEEAEGSVIKKYSQFIEGFRNHFEGDMDQAAEKIYRLMKKYKEVVDKKRKEKQKEYDSDEQIDLMARKEAKKEFYQREVSEDLKNALEQAAEEEVERQKGVGEEGSVSMKIPGERGLDYLFTQFEEELF